MSRGVFACGQCTPCRINRRRVWTHRVMLEAAQYHDNAFVTLTYNDEFLPENGSLDPKALTKFIKRLRRRSPKIRYFGCGEYGDISMRPHFHLAIFGYPMCRKGISRFNRQNRCCAACDTIQDAWSGFKGNERLPMGNILVGELTQQSAQYIAGYVVKKMTKATDPRLEGRHPEFARMSLRPGIGLGMMDELASTLLHHKLSDHMVDVPLSLQHGKKQWPLGRYLRRKLRQRIGRSERTPDEVTQKLEEEMRDVREAAFRNSENLSERIQKDQKGRLASLEAREKIHKKRTTI